MMDLRHQKLHGPKDHLQLRQQVKAYLPFILVITIFDIYLQVFVQFLIYQKKRWIFIENANSESLTLVLCSSLI